MCCTIGLSALAGAITVRTRPTAAAMLVQNLRFVAIVVSREGRGRHPRTGLLGRSAGRSSPVGWCGTSARGAGRVESRPVSGALEAELGRLAGRHVRVVVHIGPVDGAAVAAVLGAPGTGDRAVRQGRRDAPAV